MPLLMSNTTATMSASQKKICSFFRRRKIGSKFTTDSLLNHVGCAGGVTESTVKRNMRLLRSDRVLDYAFDPKTKTYVVFKVPS